MEGAAPWNAIVTNGSRHFKNGATLLITCVYAPCATPSGTYNLAIFCVSFNVRGPDRTLKCTLCRTWVRATVSGFGQNYRMIWFRKTQKFAAGPAEKNWKQCSAWGIHSVISCVSFPEVRTNEFFLKVPVQAAMEKTLLLPEFDEPQAVRKKWMTKMSMKCCARWVR